MSQHFTVGAIKYLLKYVLKVNTTTGKHCLIVLFQSIDNSPIEYVAIKWPNSLRFQEKEQQLPWGDHIIELRIFFHYPPKSIKSPNLPHFLFPAITTGNPRYPLRASLLTHPLNPALLVSTPVWVHVTPSPPSQTLPWGLLGLPPITHELSLNFPLLPWLK